MVDVDVGVEVGEGGMDDVLHPTFDTDTKLASGKEDAGKVRTEGCHKDAAGKAAIGVADANGTKLGGIGGAFMEG